MPGKVVSSLERLMSNFLLEGHFSSKILLVKWDWVTHLQLGGGLGLKYGTPCQMGMEVYEGGRLFAETSYKKHPWVRNF